MSNVSLEYLQQKEAELLAQLKIIREMMAEVKPGSPAPSYSFNGGGETLVAYGKTDRLRFKNVLKKHKRFMKVREIAKEVVRTEGGDEDEWVKKLSRCTRPLKESSTIMSYKVGNSRANVFWGSPSWIASNGSIKPDHMYDESAVIELGSSDEDEGL